MVHKTILLLAFAFVSTIGEVLFEPCYKDDLACMQKATADFLSKTYGGNADIGVKQIDPFVIPSMKINVDEDMGLEFDFQNANITGLKNIKVAEFKMDTVKKSVLLKTQADKITLNSDFKVILTKYGKVFDGQYSALATVYLTSRYGYNLKDVNGMEYFEVGPETVSCEIVEEPQVTLGGDLTNRLSQDEDAARLKPAYIAKQTAIRKKTICDLVNVGFTAIMHNLRRSAEIFPKSAFFIDI